MTDITDLIKYYQQLLIIQYSGLPKASASIGLIAETILGDGLIIDVQDAYDVDTAVGVQLDVVGKYQGIDRYFSEIDLTNYFGFALYADWPSSPPDSPPVWGYSTYAGFTDYAYNGTLLYKDVITSENALSDDNFRFLIKMKILQNNMNYSDSAIDTEIWNTFGNQVRPEDSGGMKIIYFIAGAITTQIQAALIKKTFPKPLGVLLMAVTDISGLMYSYADYAGYESPFGYGFSTYANYDSLAGQVLSYSQISSEY